MRGIPSENNFGGNGGKAIPQCLAMALFILLLTSFWFPSRSDAAVYWGTIGGMTRANLDGSFNQPGFIKSGVCAIAVDSSYIYWAENSGDSIGRANLDGTGVNHNFISPAGGGPCGLALDSGYIYWSNRTGKTIGRAKLDGSEADNSFVEDLVYPCDVAVGPAGIYWSSLDEKRIWRTNLDGVNEPKVVVDALTEPCGVALGGSHLFWADGYANRIGRANLDGSEINRNFIVGADLPRSLTIHGGGLYWLNLAAGAESIGRADLDGTSVNQRFFTPMARPYGFAVDSVQITAPPPPEPSKFSIGKLRRMGNGTVLFPVDLLGDGWLRATVPGTQVRILPENLDRSAMVKAGRKWFKISPTKKRGDGSRCVLRIFRNGGRVKLSLNVTFSESGKQMIEKKRRFLLFKPSAQVASIRAKRKRPVECFARPAPH